MTKIFAGGYWTGRRETIDSCVDRCHRWFQDVDSNTKESSIAWLENATTRGAKDQKATTADKTYLRELLLRGRSWTDIGRKLMKQLGFNAWLYARSQQGDISELHIACGGYGPFVSNVLTWYSVESVIRPIEVARYRSLLVAMADAWDPDWAGFISDETRDRRKFDARRPFVDWMVYVSHKWLPEPASFEPPASVEHLSNGTLIVVQDSPPDPDNDEHQENIRRVEQALIDRLRIE
jgi:hypothetical protein